MLRAFLIQYPIMQLGQVAALLRNVPGLSAAAPTLRAATSLFPQFPLPGIVGLVALPKVIQEISRVYPGYTLSTLDNGMQLVAIQLDLAEFLAPRPHTATTDPEAVTQFRAAVVSAITALDAAALRAWRS